MADEDVWTIGRLLEWTTGFFTRQSVDNARLDAEVLLAYVLDCRRIELYAQYDAEVAEPDRGKLREWVRRRAEGCPVAYLVGEREFYSLPFEVNSSVLIPRPETEHLVIEALARHKESPIGRFADVGAGSGAIAVTLAKQWPNAQGIAIDLSTGALAVARRNAERHEVSERIQFVESDLLAEVPPGDRFDLIVSNPPYIADDEFATLPVDVRDHEPRLALAGGPDGLGIVRRLVRESVDRLRPGGWLLFEIGAQQEAAARALFDDVPAFKLGATVRDYAGLPRVIAATRTGW